MAIKLNFKKSKIKKLFVFSCAQKFLSTSLAWENAERTRFSIQFFFLADPSRPPSSVANCDELENFPLQPKATFLLLLHLTHCFPILTL